MIKCHFKTNLMKLLKFFIFIEDAPKLIQKVWTMENENEPYNHFLIKEAKEKYPDWFNEEFFPEF